MAAALVLGVVASFVWLAAQARTEESSAAAASGDATAKTGSKADVVFRSDFEPATQPAAWSGKPEYAAGFESERSLCVRSEARGENAGASLRLSLPAAQLRGRLLRASAMVKAADVSDRPQPWNGIKLMLAIETPDRKLWPQADLGTGTFDWKRASFSARIPADATTVNLVVGLERVTGTVCFDNILIAAPKPRSAPLPAAASGPAYRGHDLPRLRGTMVSPTIDEPSLRTLGNEWHANLIRFQLIRHGRVGQAAGLDDYDAWLENELKRLDSLLPLCVKYGIYVVVDLHSPPGGKATSGGYMGTDDRLFTDKAVQDKFVEVWRQIARRYRNAKPIWGFDLANEPVEEFVEENCDDWHDLAERAARAVHDIDPQRTLIVEAPPWGSPDSLSDFIPIDVPNVVYSAHMYVPGGFTHQGVYDPKQKPVSYPGEVDGKYWDKKALEAALKPVMDFQKRYNVHIYMGEFSAIRWAPGDSACRYLRDVIEIFEEHHWDWSYHAFREWQGWSVEHGGDRNDTRPTTHPTDRQFLLLEWFGKNQKPSWAEQ